MVRLHPGVLVDIVAGSGQAVNRSRSGSHVFSTGEREASPMRQWLKYSGGQLRPGRSDVGKSRRSQRLAVAAPACARYWVACQLAWPIAIRRAAGFASSGTGMVTFRMPWS
jgi:hypothetical protein